MSIEKASLAFEATPNFLPALTLPCQQLDVAKEGEELHLDTKVIGGGAFIDRSKAGIGVRRDQ